MQHIMCMQHSMCMWPSPMTRGYCLSVWDPGRDESTAYTCNADAMPMCDDLVTVWVPHTPTDVHEASQAFNLAAICIFMPSICMPSISMPSISMPPISMPLMRMTAVSIRGLLSVRRAAVNSSQPSNALTNMAAQVHIHALHIIPALKCIDQYGSTGAHACLAYRPSPQMH